MSKKENKEILMMVNSLSNEKGVDEEVVFQAIERALATVTAKHFEEAVSIRVAIDRQSGQYEAFRCWTIVENPEGVTDPGMEIPLTDAKAIDQELEVGDIIEEPVEPAVFGRIEAQHARQVILKYVRDAERQRLVEQYRQKIGQLVTGTVKRVSRESVSVELGENVEAVMPREEVIPRETIHVGDRVRAYLYEVEDARPGPRALLTRARNEFLRALFELEVPEIGEEVIELKSVARDPGSRAKIAVKTNDGRIDPVGACVGMRGNRVQAISNELNDERIDVVLFDDNPAQFVINSMAPAEVLSIVLDEDNKSMDIAVRKDQLSQAIGRNGQNVQLASELTAWTLNVMSEEEAEQKSEEEIAQIRELFMNELDVDDSVADALIESGLTTLEEVAYVPESELLQIEEFDQDVVQEIRSRANDALLARAIAGDQEETLPSEDLYEVDGMTDEVANALAAKGITEREALAEQSVDDLADISELNEEKAAQLIMNARAHWFSDEQ